MIVVKWHTRQRRGPPQQNTSKAINNQTYPTKVSYGNQSSSGFINEVDSKFISEIERVHISPCPPSLNF